MKTERSNSFEFSGDLSARSSLFARLFGGSWSNSFRLKRSRRRRSPGMLKRLGRVLWSTAVGGLLLGCSSLPSRSIGVADALEVLEHSNERSARATAYRSLADRRTLDRLDDDSRERVAQKLYRLTTEEPDPTLRASAVKAINSCGLNGAEAVELFARTADDRESIVRLRTAEALAEYRSTESAALLRKLATDRQVDVRRRAVISLASREMPSADQDLLSALRDGDPGIVAAAVEGLRIRTNADFGADYAAWSRALRRPADQTDTEVMPVSGVIDQSRTTGDVVPAR
jgi:HEAT repeat protein